MLTLWPDAYYVEDLADPLNHDVQHKYYIEDVHAMIVRFFSLPKEEAVVKSKLEEWQSQTALRHKVRELLDVDESSLMVFCVASYPYHRIFEDVKHSEEAAVIDHQDREVREVRHHIPLFSLI